MKIIGICGSPRAGGNTEQSINVVLTECATLGAETELITLCDKTLHGCKGCYSCIEAKSCVIQDDYQAIFRAMTEADGIILGSPSYHASITPELKCLLDRAGFSGRWAGNDMKEKSEGYTWTGCAWSGKVVAPLSVARRAGQDFTFAQLLLWATCNDCLVVGNMYWNISIAGKGGAMDAIDDVEGIENYKGLARRMVNTIQKLNT